MIVNYDRIEHVIAIGFLLGALVGLLFVPTVHNRAVRLTTKVMARNVPDSLVDLVAAKDLARAEFATATRQMELRFERRRTMAIADARRLAKKDERINRQIIEICALRARIAGLESKFLDRTEILSAPAEKSRVVAIRRRQQRLGDALDLAPAPEGRQTRSG